MTYRRKRKAESEKLNFWQSYSDMMAGLLLVFALILTGALLESKVAYEQKEADLIKKEEQYEEAQKKLVAAQQSLVDEQAALDEQTEEMQSMQEELESQQSTIDEQTAQLEKILGVKEELIKALQDEFSDSDLNVTVDAQTGAITFDSNLLFDSAQSTLKTDGKTFLKSFLPRYFDVLLSDKFKDDVAEIIIEGHTDTDGNYLYNLELSQDRALEVATYCLDEDNSVLTDSMLTELRPLLTANGRSYSAAIYDDEGEIDKAASRRVEIKFRLKDDEMIQKMIDLINNGDGDAQ